MQATYNAGTHVMYPSGGICYVDAVEKRDFSGTEREYYIMHPISNPSSTIYVPLDSEKLTSLMLPLVSDADIDSLIADAETVDHPWISDHKVRAEKFDEILHSGRRADLLWLIKTLSAHKEEVTKQRKRLYAADERILSSATKLIVEEFAFVLGLNESDVIPYIKDRAAALRA